MATETYSRDEFREWLAAFRPALDSLAIKRRTRNALIRATRLPEVGAPFSNADGYLLSFEAWRQAILDGGAYPKVSEIYGLGSVGIKELTVALQETKGV